jgi:hypothetical protein
MTRYIRFPEVSEIDTEEFFQSMPVTGRRGTEKGAPRPHATPPLKGEGFQPGTVFDEAAESYHPDMLSASDDTV